MVTSAQGRVEAMQDRPAYTVPRNATLIGSTSMTALVGRIPIQGQVRDPMPFKVITGADNLAANGLTVPGVQGMVWSGTAVGDWTLLVSPAASNRSPSSSTTARSGQSRATIVPDPQSHRPGKARGGRRLRRGCADTGRRGGGRAGDGDQEQTLSVQHGLLRERPGSGVATRQRQSTERAAAAECATADHAGGRSAGTRQLPLQSSDGVRRATGPFESTSSPGVFASHRQPSAAV